MKIFYKVNKGLEDYAIVEGETIGRYFAGRSERGAGWRITHLKSGILLSATGFSCLAVAELFINLLEALFGVDADEISYKSTPFQRCKTQEQRIFTQFLFTMKTMPIVTAGDIEELSKRIYGE